MKTATVTGGLRVERSHTGNGWIIRHEQSGTTFGLWLRLRRHAEAAVAEFLATGEDFTQSRDRLRKSPKGRAVGTVLDRWVKLERYCCAGGEHYSPRTYAMDGRCTGPLGNGQPRRS